MTSRGGEWHLLDLDSDPVPPDQDEVANVADEFARRGDTMTRAARALGDASQLEEWTGKASSEFSEKAEKAHGDLDKAAQKYTDAGRAIRTYSHAVGVARDDTKAALVKAVTADQDVQRHATSKLEDVPSPTPEQDADDQLRKEKLATARGELAEAKADLRRAMETLHAAAKTCASRIRSASEHYKDSKMDNIKGVVRAALKVLVDALNVIALVLAVVIIVLLVIGSGGLLGILITGAFYLGATIFALTAVQYKMGDASKGELALATLGLIGGGTNKLASKLTASTLKTVRSATYARQIATAKNALSPSIKSALRITSNQNNLKIWARGMQTQAIRAAVDGTTGAVQATKVTNPLVKASGFADVVASQRQIKLLGSLGATATDARNLRLATNLNRLDTAGITLNQGTQIYQVPHLSMAGR
jgi:uncharacterized protein YukE